MSFLDTPPRSRSALGSRAHRVSWLELFFDLVFVAAVAQVAEPLRHHYSVDELLRLTPLLLLIWWAWTGQTLFGTRFEIDTPRQRVLTFLQMFIVAAMAANATEALDSRSSAGFVAAYAALRVLLVAQYLRARRVEEARPLANQYAVGHGAAAAIWLISALVPAPVRFWLWAGAFAIDLGTPWLAVRHTVRAPPQPAHLPERFGLFTLILLGDSVIAVMKGMESHEDWPPAAAASALLGMAIICSIWWWYFGGAGGGSEQHVRTRRGAVRFHLWTYAHFPFYLGVMMAGVGLQRIVMAAARRPLETGEVLLLTAGVTLVMLALAVIEALGAGARVPRARFVRRVALAAATAVVGTIGVPTVSVVLVLSLALLLLAQLALSLPSALDTAGQGAASQTAG